jgi:hypothetical protein
LPLLGRQIETKIVKKEATDDALWGGINVSTYDKHGILGLFVNIDNASYLKDKREKAMRKAVFIGKLFETNGSVVPDNKRYQFPKNLGRDRQRLIGVR